MMLCTFIAKWSFSPRLDNIYFILSKTVKKLCRKYVDYILEYYNDILQSTWCNIGFIKLTFIKYLAMLTVPKHIRIHKNRYNKS